MWEHFLDNSRVLCLTCAMLDRYFDWKWFLCLHLWQVCPDTEHWRFPWLYPQSMHSGRLSASRGFLAFCLTAPTESSLTLLMSFNRWLVCFAALQISIAFCKVRSLNQPFVDIFVSDSTVWTGFCNHAQLGHVGGNAFAGLYFTII